MKYAIQLIIYCLLFTFTVWLSVRKGAADGLFFYPAAYQERAVQLGIADREEIARKKKAFMPVFAAVMALALVLIVGVWDRAGDFRRAYLLCLMFLEVMNWYDGIVIDRLWVGRSSFWVIPGMEGVPYIQTWGQVFRKRIIYSLVWVAGAALPAAAAMLIS